jgi:hypothetical protein
VGKRGNSAVQNRFFVPQSSARSPRCKFKFKLKLSRRGFLRGALAGAAAMSALPAGWQHGAAIRLAQDEAEPVALGAYLPNVLYDPAVLPKFTAAIEREPDFLVWYEAWADGEFDEERQQNLRTLDEWGITPVIAWDPFDPDGPTIDQSAYKLSNIIRGDFDAYIDGWANGLADFGRPVFLNFAHEMNGNWYPWGIGVNGNQPGEFSLAWRHVHDRFTAAGAINVVWVWTPNEMYEDVPATVEEVYPGDDYVNWFGMNGFNWGENIRWRSCDCQSAWRTFHEIFDTTYQRLVALGDKPIMIGEVGSSEVGGDKAAWITEAFLEELPLNYPRIRAVAWFNNIASGLDTVAPGVVEPTTAEVDWRVTSSRAALDAFATAVGAPYYQGSLV